MSVVVRLQSDEALDQDALRFQLGLLPDPLFLNSVPKSGTHLLRNIVRTFIPVESQYRRDVIQIANIQANLPAFDPQARLMSWGHMLFTDTTAMAVQGARHIVLVRDPHDWVLAMTRFYLSDQYRGPLQQVAKQAQHLEEVYNLVIFGAFQKNPSLQEIFTFNALAWIGTRAHIVRYEDILLHVERIGEAAAEPFFKELLANCGIGPLPADWRDRIRLGADRKYSGTSREKLTGVALAVPDELPEAQRRLVELGAPGVRAALGYQ